MSGLLYGLYSCDVIFCIWGGGELGLFIKACRASVFVDEIFLFNIINFNLSWFLDGWGYEQNQYAPEFGDNGSGQTKRKLVSMIFTIRQLTKSKPFLSFSYKTPPSFYIIKN